MSVPMANVQALAGREPGRPALRSLFFQPNGVQLMEDLMTPSGPRGRDVAGLRQVPGPAATGPRSGRGERGRRLGGKGPGVSASRRGLGGPHSPAAFAPWGNRGSGRRCDPPTVANESPVAPRLEPGDLNSQSTSPHPQHAQPQGQTGTELTQTAGAVGLQL